MNQLDQVNLGFSQVRAAIVGGHDLKAAFDEIPTMMGGGERPYVVTGGVGCLLLCIEAIERAGRLPDAVMPGPFDFIHSGHVARLKACEIAMSKSDFLPISLLVAVMIHCIKPLQSQISFDGKNPRLPASDCRQGK